MNWFRVVFVINLFLLEDRWVVLVYFNIEFIYRYLFENFFVVGDGRAVYIYFDV